ncbi:MAG TPA: methyltransferase [Candidatus Acidoferrales bacterium]
MISHEAVVPPSAADAARIRAFFTEAQYSRDYMLQYLGMEKLPNPRGHDKVVLMDLTSERVPSNVLFRLFYMGVTLDRAELSGIIPDWFIEAACDCKLLRVEGKQLAPEAMIVPLAGQWIASDLGERFDASVPDFVLWPNPTSQLLMRLSVRRPSRATLDLGTGTGVIAISAAAYSERVIATDLNLRALEFARFNAQLNGTKNIELRLGDGFAPVKGEKFDLILSNPPFFVTPSNHFLFCDNPMELDQLCRNIAREAAEHLNEGGYFEMLCEWAEVEGQPWRARVAEWFEGTGCDAWIVNCQSRNARQYASDRISEAHDSCDAAPDTFREYMDYYRARNVASIHDGIVVMRRRSGKNWVAIEESERTPDTPFGDLIVSRFAARDFLEARASIEQMLMTKPLVSPHARLEQVAQPGEHGWEPAGLTLRMAKGFPTKIAVQPLVAEFLSSCNGKRTLKEIAGDMVERLGGPEDQVQIECVEIIRKMVAQGFVLGT